MNRRDFLQLFGGAAVATVTAAVVVDSNNEPNQEMKPYLASDEFISIGTSLPIYRVSYGTAGPVINAVLLTGGTVQF